jgi:hypothetical protein
MGLIFPKNLEFHEYDGSPETLPSKGTEEHWLGEAKVLVFRENLDGSFVDEHYFTAYRHNFFDYWVLYAWCIEVDSESCGICQDLIPEEIEEDEEPIESDYVQIKEDFQSEYEACCSTPFQIGDMWAYIQEPVE